MLVPVEWPIYSMDKRKLYVNSEDDIRHVTFGYYHLVMSFW